MQKKKKKNASFIRTYERFELYLTCLILWIKYQIHFRRKTNDVCYFMPAVG